MNEWVDITASQDNIWLVTVIHGIDGIGYEPLTGQTVDDHFSYIKSKENDLWVATLAIEQKTLRSSPYLEDLCQS